MRNDTGKKILLFIFTLVFICAMLWLAASAFHIISPGVFGAIADFLMNGSPFLRILLGIISALIAIISLVLVISSDRKAKDAGRNIPICGTGENGENAFVSCSAVDALVEKQVRQNKSVKKVECRVSDIDIEGIKLNLKLEVLEDANMVRLCSELQTQIADQISGITGVKVRDIVISIVGTVSTNKSTSIERRVN